MAKREISRGSLWNQWDLHVHTPASFHWLGKKFEGDLSSDVNKALVDEMIDAMNKAEPAVLPSWIIGHSMVGSRSSDGLQNKTLLSFTRKCSLESSCAFLPLLR